MRHPLQQLADSLAEGQAYLITSPENRLYVTGQKTSAGTVLITQKEAYFIIDFRYFEKVRHQVSDLQMILQANLYEQLNELLASHGIKEVFAELSRMPFTELLSWKKALTAPISDETRLDEVIGDLRNHKTEAEMKKIIAAQEMTDQAFAWILDHIHAGRTEAEVALDLEFFCRKLGSDGVAFDFIVVSGQKSALPHGSPDQKIIEKGDFVTMDFGCVVDGYRSDMTRTVAVEYATDEMQKVYQTVLDAQLAALQVYRPGVTGKEADAAARDLITKAGYGDAFGHGLGHGVGIEIHEAPTANWKSEQVMEKGMTLTCEPGIYLAGKFGVRIEDMGVFTETGFENITRSPKNLILVK